MEIRDVIHGTIEVSDDEAKIIESRFFQRLRNIKQLGFAENSYPGATHNRFSHSLGATHLASFALDKALNRDKGSAPDGARVPADDYARLRAAIRVAAMLHDIGHGPLSHTTEFAMPRVEALGLGQVGGVPSSNPSFRSNRQGRRANHEDYTLNIILHSSLTPILEQALQAHGVRPLHLACILNEEIVCPDGFFESNGIDYRPILHQLVSSEIDVDRMDYLNRDSYHAGVNYGKFDIGFMLANLTHHVVETGNARRCHLALRHRAIYTFDDFLISRYHMFLMVYFHHKSVIFDEMLERYLRSPDCDYAITGDTESYVYYDDYHLYTHLSRSENVWARRIYHKNPYKMLAEFHSGIPVGLEHAREQKAALDRTVEELSARGVDCIVKTTTSEFSKYFRKREQWPIFVRYEARLGEPRFIPLEECTDVFEKYIKSRSITRVYAPETFP